VQSASLEDDKPQPTKQMTSYLQHQVPQFESYSH